MAGKKRKYRHNGSFSKAVAVLIIIFAVFHYFYTNNQTFKTYVDLKKQQLIAKITPAVPHVTRNDSSGEIFQPEPAGSKIQSGDLPQSSFSSENKKNEKVSLSRNLELPVCSGGQDHQKRSFSHYSICYRESYEQAEWSAYCLTEDELVKNTGRSDDFRPDPEIKTGSASLADYKGSGYDRGHLSPAADFAFAKEAMSETFFMSNMSPQAANLNRGIWKDLESEVRKWAGKFGRIYVISGPVLEKPASEYDSIGANRVSIPQYYYKVLLSPLYENEADRAEPENAKSVTALGFIFPNKKCEGELFSYAVSVDEVERRTGLDFFSMLDDSTEEEVEETVDLSYWKQK